MPYASNQDVRIYWEEEGEGEPLLMIMGLSLSLAMWGELRASMARHFRTIVFDNREVGRSDKPGPPFSIASMARDATAVLDAAGVASAHVLGVSMGGMIAQELALRTPERVRKLVLGCTHCGGLNAILGEARALRGLITGLLSPAAKVRAVAPFLYAPDTPQDRIERDLEIMLANAPGTLGYLKQISAILFWHSYRRLPRIKAPTLVLHGDSDRLIPPENARILADRIPDARLVIIPQAGHIFPTDQPEATRKELIEFLMSPVPAGA